MAAGSIVIDLLMKTGSFETDTKKAEKRLKELEKTAKEWASATATAATAAATAFAYFTKQSIDNMDKMYKMSQMAGVTTESLTSMGYAAQLSGVNQEDLTASLVKLSNKLSEAQAGAEDATAAFKTIGINPKLFKSADDAMLALAERFASFEDGANKTALAIEFFGRSGAQLIPFLNAGRDGIEDLRKEAKRLGVVFNDDAAKSAEQFNDNVERLKVGLQGLINTITIDLLPALNQFVTGLNNISQTSFWGWFTTSTKEEQNAAETIDEIAQKIDKLKASKEALQANKFLSWYNADDVAIVDTQIALLTKKLEYLSKTLLSVPQIKINWDTDQVESAIVPTKTSAPLVTKPTKGAAKISEYDQAIEKLREQAALLGKNTELEKTLANIQLGRYGKLTEDQRTNLTYLAEQVDLERQSVENWKQYTDFISEVTGRGDADKFVQQMSMLATALAEGAINAEQYEAGIKKLSDGLKETTDDMGEFAKEAARNIQDALGDTLEQVLSGNFKNIGDSFGRMLQRMTAQLASSQLNKLLFGSFDKSGDIGGIVGSLGKAVASLFNPTAAATDVGTIGYNDFFAAGGYTGTGGKYEPAGVVHRGEYVINADSTKKLGTGFLDRLNGYANGGYVGNPPMSVGGGVNINIKNEAGGDGYQATAQARRNESGLDIDIVVKKVIANDLRNNGGLSQQMAATFGLRRGG